MEGARRIGKSTVRKRFAEENYKSYIIIDFAKANKKTKDNFDNLDNLDIFFQNLSLLYNTRLYRNESLIIFDEVQKFPRAREAIKYLVNDGRYSYIETGSLISIKENINDIVIPSEEHKIKMYPLDFEEFLWAANELVLIDYIKECVKKKQPLDDIYHKKAMRLFKIAGISTLQIWRKEKFYLCTRMTFLKRVKNIVLRLQRCLKIYPDIFLLTKKRLFYLKSIPIPRSASMMNRYFGLMIR